MIDTAAEQKLYEATTQGEWHATTCDIECYEEGGGGCPRELDEMDDACRKCENCRFISGAMVPETKTVEWGDYDDMSDEDAAWIAHAHNEWPAIMAEIDKGRELARDILCGLGEQIQIGDDWSAYMMEKYGDRLRRIAEGGQT